MLWIAKLVRLHVRLAVIAASLFLTLTASPRALSAADTLGNPDHLPLSGDLWVGKYSQCSFNAVSSMLTYYYGPADSKLDRDAFERTVFCDPLNSVGLGAYYGWGPWTSYMVESGKMEWNGKLVNALRSERFALRPVKQPGIQGDVFIVHYADGEREDLRARLLKNLSRGPVVMWTCYAGAQEKGSGQPWHHVSRLDDHADAVPFGPFTHSVTLFLLPRDVNQLELTGDIDRVLVTDCSVRRGTFVTDPDTIVSTAAAMTSFVRIHVPGEKSILERGLNGVKNDEYNVVFFPASAEAPATQPAAQPAGESPHAATAEHAAPVAFDETSLMASLPEDRRAGVATALQKAGDRKVDWLAALAQVPGGQREGFAFLLANMPERDLASLDPDFARENVSLAYDARAAHPWGKDLPKEIFLDAVLPYANLNEQRDHWRPDFADQFGPLVRNCRSATEAALLLNATIFKQVGVRYHATKRPKPDQSPMESIAAGYASCSGLSILLVDACRAVGVPARIVGIPYWVKPKDAPEPQEAGNHTWVEIWDGQWHIIGASEISPLDQSWFLPGAAQALEGLSRTDGLDHHIYAACWHETATPFRLVWDPSIAYVHAEDVTASYANRIAVKLRTHTPTHLTIRQAGWLIADLNIQAEATLILSAGQSYEARIDSPTNELESFVVPTSSAPVIDLPRDGGDSLQRPSQFLPN